MPFENLLPTSRQKIMLDQGDKHMESSSDPEEGRPDTERLAEEIRTFEDRPDWKRLVDEIRKIFGFE